MRLRLIAVGTRMPRWVEEGWHEYVKRLPSELSLELVEIPLTTRGKNADVARMIRQEGEAMLAKVQPGERIVTLEVQGRPWSTEQLAAELDRTWGARIAAAPTRFSPDVLASAEVGAEIDDAEIAALGERLAVERSAVEARLAGFDVVVAPTAIGPPPSPAAASVREP